MIKLPRLILASGSPRRAEILTAVGWQFTKQVADVDESIRPAETPENYVRRLAQEKAVAVAALHENALVLGADTTVVINDEIIGKPVDFAEAREMLKKLSGNWHEVLTGVALVKVAESTAAAVAGWTSQFETQVAFERTRVKFAALNDAEIEFLVEKGEPLDKAGAYAVQAQAALFIEGIEGDYWNVVGLPVHLVYELMRKMQR
ncbi:MAG TPA: Maf family protein [Pyrinomonadaceae bacterium]|jgi:septum formation protein